MLELALLKHFLSHKNYKAFRHVLDPDKLRAESSELAMMLTSLDQHFEQHPESDLSPDDLHLLVTANYPGLTSAKRAGLTAVFDRFRELDASEQTLEAICQRLEEQNRAHEIMLAAIDVAQGGKTYDELAGKLRDLGSLSAAAGKSLANPLLHYRVTADTLVDTKRTSGLQWSLQALRKSLGPIGGGDFGFIVGRPESGKSTLVDCEGVQMAFQMDVPTLWVANEEKGSAVLSRITQSRLGWTNAQIRGNRAEFEAEAAKIAERIILIHKPDVSAKQLYALCKAVNPGLLIIDQLDKIVGFEDDRYDLELGAIYQWARKVAAEFCPVIGVTQASESAEGKRWLEMSDIANSKTSKAAEADWIVAVGRTHQQGMAPVRHLHILKNKLAGDSETVEEYRHGKFDVQILAEVARYKDVMEWTTS